MIKMQINIFKYITLILLNMLLSLCGDKDVRLYPSFKFNISFDLGNKPGEPAGGSEDEKSLTLKDIIETIKNLDIDGTIEDVVVERSGYQGVVDYSGDLEELELSVRLKIDEEEFDIVSGITISLESIRTGEDFDLSGELNEEGVSLLRESIQLLVEKIVNKESLEDFNRSIEVSIDNLPPDEEIYVKIILNYIIAVRYKETVNLL